MPDDYFNNLIPLPLSIVVVFIFGAMIGSFLNVVIYRLPRERSVVFPNSSCGECGAAVKFYDNIPILSYLILGGRCRACRAPFSIRYPAVELLTAILFTLVFLRDGWTLSLFFDLVFISSLIALIFIDAEHMILPNKITYPGFIVALIARVIVPNLYGVEFMKTNLLNTSPDWFVSLVGALLGATVGGGSLWLLGWIWERLRGVEAMGLGDVKMMLMVGAYLGWPLTVLTIFIGFVTGSVAGVLLMARRGERDMQTMLPFGIFLGIGAIISLFLGRAIVAWYAGQFQ
jgi:leader peptidase (prepilin peptidase) / N-methyltransferase